MTDCGKGSEINKKLKRITEKCEKGLNRLKFYLQKVDVRMDACEIQKSVISTEDKL